MATTQETRHQWSPITTVKELCSLIIMNKENIINSVLDLRIIYILKKQPATCIEKNMP